MGITSPCKLSFRRSFISPSISPWCKEKHFDNSFMSESFGRYLHLMFFIFGQYRIKYFNCLGDIFPLDSMISNFRCSGIDLGPTDLELKLKDCAY